jgi:hypothetical protein
MITATIAAITSSLAFKPTTKKMVLGAPANILYNNTCIQANLYTDASNGPCTRLFTGAQCTVTIGTVVSPAFDQGTNCTIPLRRM